MGGTQERMELGKALSMSEDIPRQAWLPEPGAKPFRSLGKAWDRKVGAWKRTEAHP